MASCSDDDEPNQNSTSGNPNDYGQITGDYLVATGSYKDAQMFDAYVLSSADLTKIQKTEQNYQLGIAYSCDTETPTLDNSYEIIDNPSSKNITQLHNLYAGITYYYRAYLKMNGNIYYAKETRSFTTTEISVTLGEAQDVNSYGATFTSTFDATKFLSTKYKCGIVVSLEEKPNSKNGTLFTTSNVDGNSFTVIAKGLTPNKTYYCRSFILINDCYYFSGQIQSFVTSDIQLSVASIENISMFGATINCLLENDKSDGMTAGILVATDENPTVENSSIIKGSINDSGLIVVKLGNQSPGKKFYVKGWIKMNDNYILSSNTKSFSTPDLDIENCSMQDVRDDNAIASYTFDKSKIDRTCKAIGIVYGEKSSLGFTNDFVSASPAGTQYTAALSNLNTSTKYYYAPAIKIARDTSYDDVMISSQYIEYIEYIGKTLTFTTLAPIGGTPVDLGLPSKKKWAAKNLGAENPEDIGTLYYWGTTSTNSSSTWNNVEYTTIKSKGVIDSNGNLVAAYDAATVNWGSKWRMPTYDELKELADNCSWERSTLNGVEGYWLTGPNGNKIFLQGINVEYMPSTMHAPTSSQYKNGHVNYLTIGPMASSKGYFIDEGFALNLLTKYRIRPIYNK